MTKPTRTKATEVFNKIRAAALALLCCRHNNQYTQRMKFNEIQMMSIFLNKVFYHRSLLCLAKTDHAPARTGDLLRQVLVTLQEAWHRAPEFAAWMKPPPSLQLLLWALLQVGNRPGNPSPKSGIVAFSQSPGDCGTVARGWDRVEHGGWDS